MVPNCFRSAPPQASQTVSDGSRLGGGRGFFDKTIAAMAECPPVYAVVHDEELFDSVPHAAYDQPVDGVVTQSGIHHTS